MSTPVDGMPVPVAGVGPKAKIRWSRGEAVVGSVHATMETFEPGGNSVVTALCGRKVRPLVVWAPSAWPTLVGDFHRASGGHDVNTCGGCVAKHLARMEGYSYCEPVTVTGHRPWHIRRLDGDRLRTGGGVTGSALCGRDVTYGWDIAVPVDPSGPRFSEITCSRCASALRTPA